MSTNPTQAQIAAEAQALSQQYGIPASVIMSVIQSESSYRQFDSSGNPLYNVPALPATSSSGAVGLMQVKENSVPPPLTYDQVSNDWHANMQAGASILSKDIQNANPGQTPGQDGWSAAQIAAGLPAYGGFGKNDPSTYVNKIMTNANMSGYPQVGPPSSSANGPLLPGVSGAAVEALPVIGRPITDTADPNASYDEKTGNLTFNADDLKDPAGRDAQFVQALQAAGIISTDWKPGWVDDGTGTGQGRSTLTYNHHVTNVTSNNPHVTTLQVAPVSTSHPKNELVIPRADKWGAHLLPQSIDF